MTADLCYGLCDADKHDSSISASMVAAYLRLTLTPEQERKVLEAGQSIFPYRGSRICI